MQELIVREDMLEYKDRQGMARAYEKMVLWKQTVAAMEARLKERLAASFKQDGTPVDLGNDRILVHSQKKKETWKTQEVYDLFSVPDEVRAVLESNPNFRKKALEKLLGSKDEVNKLLNVEMQDVFEVKEINTKFIGE